MGWKGVKRAMGDAGEWSKRRRWSARCLAREVKRGSECWKTCQEVEVFEQVCQSRMPSGVEGWWGLGMDGSTPTGEQARMRPIGHWAASARVPVPVLVAVAAALVSAHGERRGPSFAYKADLNDGVGIDHPACRIGITATSD